MTNPHRRRTIEIVQAGLKKRRAAERRFQIYGMSAVIAGVAFLLIMLVAIVGNGYTAFYQTYVELDVEFNGKLLDPDGSRDPKVLKSADYQKLVKKTVYAMFPEVKGRRDKRKLVRMISKGAAYQLRDMVVSDPSLIDTSRRVWVPVASKVDMVMKGHIDRTAEEADRPISDMELGWIDKLEKEGRLKERFNTLFFTRGDSRNPELAGILGAVVGSFYTLLVTLVLSFPVAIATAVYLEEFAKRNRWTDMIEVNINNLAAVPSIIFGLLGLSVFLNYFEMPRSTALVGGMVLALMTLPTIIISSRAALQSVPRSIREAALGMGASKMQTIGHHVLPMAMPGVLTGTIIGMARALGETAPLLMIGMVAFIVDIPHGITEPTTVLPVQIFLWADSPERGYVERMSAAIMVLLAFLIIMNGLAVFLRSRFERRW